MLFNTNENSCCAQVDAPRCTVRPSELDPNKRYSEDESWVEDITILMEEYLAGGFGNMESAPELRAILDDFMPYYCDNADMPAREMKFPEEIMRRYVKHMLDWSTLNGKIWS